MVDIGKVEYSPDYKSVALPCLGRYRAHAGNPCSRCGSKIGEKKYPDTADVFGQINRRAELHRLEAAVIKAAKEWRRIDPAHTIANDRELIYAVDALRHFEAQQQ